MVVVNLAKIYRSKSVNKFHFMNFELFNVARCIPSYRDEECCHKFHVFSQRYTAHAHHVFVNAIVN